ncbi:MAG: ATP-grasp domain-containing protein [Clostridiales bacterium]|nr:ATP-grasp domain-containing protein [Clostridiales bacterium]
MSVVDKIKRDFNLLKHIRENDDYTVIWLFNIGLEKYWNGEVYTVKNAKEDVIVNHIEEMNLLLTRKQDILIIRTMPEAAYLHEMEQFGCVLPTIVCPAKEDETKSISELVLEDEVLISEIKRLLKGNDKVIFVPYGVSYLEEEIALKLGVSMFGSSNEINRMVNNKVFSRQFAIEHDFRVSKGWVCSGFAELEETAKKAVYKYPKIIIKEPCGASGKGLWVVEGGNELRSVLLVIKRFFKDRLGGDWLLEEWCDKVADLNYQIYVGEDGEVEVFSIKEQKVNGTVYVGSVMPPSFSEKIMKECRECGEIIGRELYQKGYRGILGVDAMILAGGELIPIIEINGRFTLSTYVSFVQEQIKAAKVFAFYRKIALGVQDDYTAVKDKLIKENLWFDGGSEGSRGMFVYTGESIREQRIGDSGRLFGLIFADDEEDMNRQYQEAMQILERKDKA